MEHNKLHSTFLVYSMSVSMLLQSCGITLGTPQYEEFTPSLNGSRMEIELVVEQDRRSPATPANLNDDDKNDKNRLDVPLEISLCSAGLVFAGHTEDHATDVIPYEQPEELEIFENVALGVLQFQGNYFHQLTTVSLGLLSRCGPAGERYLARVKNRLGDFIVDGSRIVVPFHFQATGASLPAKGDYVLQLKLNPQFVAAMKNASSEAEIRVVLQNLEGRIEVVSSGD